MAFQDSQNTIEKLYEILGFEAGENLAITETPPENIYEKSFLETASKKLGIDSIFFYRPPNGGTSIPYIYFRRFEGVDPTKLSHEIANLHRLAWHTGRAPLLFAVLPAGQVLIYNNYVLPKSFEDGREYQTGLIHSLNIFSEAEAERCKLTQYHCHEFESGRYWRENSRRFDPKYRVDQTLLDNLKVVRHKLLLLLSKNTRFEIASEVTHSLLGRSIFLKYLEDRKDSFQNNVFPDGYFHQFKQNAESFIEILDSKKATYELFESLSKKFNGDIFPIEDTEYDLIEDDHLIELRSLLTGKEELVSGQLNLWEFYSFDIIPIEFISNIYEEFFHIRQKELSGKKVAKTGTHFTPHHLVEFLVDEVLPWEGTETSLKTIDPACGSGIFLVEVYRRLIARWHQANPDQKIMPNQLIGLLTKNIFGVDSNKEAIRVAAFSLYLTLCDYLEPRQIWADVKFPPLRQKNLFPSDFFENNKQLEKQQFELIIGNPPWQSKLTKATERYCLDMKTKFPKREFAPDNQIALAFLWRTSEFCKSTGEICLLMPSKGFLFNRSGTHRSFRRDFFNTYHVKTIINLSAFRHSLFEKGVGPASAVFFTTEKPDGEIPILYCSPKPSHSSQDKWQITIEPQDIAQLPRADAVENDIIWKVAMWGGPRDYELIKKLMTTSFQTFEEICIKRGWIDGEGFIRGNKSDDASWLFGKPFVRAGDLKRFAIDKENLPSFDIPKLERPRKKKKAIYQGPHILIKQSPVAGESSFRAALLQYDAVFNHSIIGINGPLDDIVLLAKCCLILNSRTLFYFALMSSRQWLVERDAPEKNEIMNFPLPKNFDYDSDLLENLKKISKEENWEGKIQALAEKLYDLTEEEKILVDDAINYTLDYFRLKAKSDAAKPTFNKTDGESFLKQYSLVLNNTLQNAFNKHFTPIIFRGSSPLRVVALRLKDENRDYSEEMIIEESQESLNQALNDVNQNLVEQRSPGVFIRRNVRVYIDKAIYIVKPDQRRYWTRASALRDADEIYADIMEAWRASD